VLSRKKIESQIKAVLEEYTCKAGISLLNELEKDLQLSIYDKNCAVDVLEKKYDIILDNHDTWVTVKNIVDSVEESLIESGEIVYDDVTIEEL
jgi:hypothetical protein